MLQAPKHCSGIRKKKDMQKSRRNFIKKSTTALASTAILPWYSILNKKEKLSNFTIGHNNHQYKVDLNWGALNSNFYPVNDCHEMVQDSKGRIILLTNETKNNIIIYDKSGKILSTWGSDYPGAHGLTISDEGGEEFLYIADNNRHEVIKTTLDGKEVMTLPWPKDSKKYKEASQYIPTETAIAPNGDIYVADGYGQQYILHYNSKGKLKNIFGGRGDGDKHFDNAHGICLDTRTSKPTLLISARQRNQLKRFSLKGKHLETIDLPGAFICRPVVDDKNVYMAVLVSKPPFDSQSGYLCILDENNQVISNPGGSIPTYKDNVLQKMYQTVKVFQHPHDVCVDEDKNLYVAQWNSGKTYPIKLVRV